MDYEFNIIYYLNLYKRNWKILVILIVVAMFTARIFDSLKPLTYTSTVTIILPPEGSTARSSIGSYLGIPSLSMGITSEDIIISIIKSRRMAKDINNHFQSDKRPNFWWSVNVYRITAGLAVEARGSDPALTEKIANFCVANLDKINSELNITSDRPMVKVLDSATYGSPEGRNTSRKMFVAGLFIFLMGSLFIYLEDYLRKIKSSHE